MCVGVHEGHSATTRYHSSRAPHLRSCLPLQVKVWQWAVVSAPDGGARQLRLAHSRSVAMADDVLAVRVSPDGKLIAVALLDSTVKVRGARAACFVTSARVASAVWGMGFVGAGGGNAEAPRARAC